MTFSTDRRELLALSGAALLLPRLSAEAIASEASPGLNGEGRDQPLLDGWLFRRGAASGLEDPSLDDSDWRYIDLPHDWCVEDIVGGKHPDQRGPFDKQAAGGAASGYVNGGEGWYRKRFDLPGLAANARVEVVFDGVYAESEVWLNGAKVGEHFHGYAPFAVDLTRSLNRSGENVLAVRVRSPGHSSRWYSGAGIYRQVNLDVLPAGARFARWGIAASTRRIAGKRAEVEIATTIDEPDPGVEVVVRLREADGRVAAQAARRAAASTRLSLTVPAPRLWSPASPYLYTLEAELLRAGVVIDRVVQQTGLRIVTMDARQGLHINGERVVLRGGCIHHDNGLLGGCAYADADERRIRLLQARGFNAIRSSHNPASRTLRSACDRLGMLMIEEAFDMWHVGKNPEDYAKHFASDWERPLAAMVQSARNSPSVIMWSIGNEIPSRVSPEGLEWSWKLANTTRRLDPTRPVTAAINGLLGPLLKADADSARPGKSGQPDNAATIFLDVAGYNYRLGYVEPDHADHRDRVIYASETYPRDAYEYTQMARRLPYMLGEFVWAAMDYLGEAGLGSPVPVPNLPYHMASWPWVNAWCGDIDLIGNQKPQSLYRDVVWGKSQLEITVQNPPSSDKPANVSLWGWPDELPSWTWSGQDGRRMTVRVYASGDRVELWLNGVKIAEKNIHAENKLISEFEIPYQPGRLEAVAYGGGNELGRRFLQTAGDAARLRLTPESRMSGATRQNLSFLGLEILDAAGTVLPDDERQVSIKVAGPAELVGFGSANPLAVGSLQSSVARTFRGRALAIFRSTGQTGDIRIVASSDGLAGAATEIRLA